MTIPRSHVRGVSTLGELDPIAEFAELAKPANREAAFKLIDSRCSQCGAAITVPAMSPNSCACDECKEKAVMADFQSHAERRWSMEDLCPLGSVFRATDPNHPNFPKTQYEQTRAWAGNETLIFIGPSGTGKTRLAMHLLKRCLFLHRREVAVLWPDELRTLARSRDGGDLIGAYARVAVLLLDDPFLSGYADDRIGELLKDLLDKRARLGRRHIITTQFGGDQYREAFMSFCQRSGRKATSQDWARFDALFRRVRENARDLVFGDVPRASAQAGASNESTELF